MVNALEIPSSGTVCISGKDVATLDPIQLRRDIGYVIQDVGLFPNKTVFDNVATVLKLTKKPKDFIRKRVFEVLSWVNLDANIFSKRYPNELSGGEQQRVGVARALAADPSILLMDEPFGAIDPLNRIQIQDLFLSLQAKLKKTIIFVSHDIQEALKMADKIALFQDGKLIQYDSPLSIITHPKNDFVSGFFSHDRIFQALSLIPISSIFHPSDVSIDLIAPKILQQESLKSALSMMLYHNTNSLIVCDTHNKPIGLLSQNEIQLHLAQWKITPNA